MPEGTGLQWETRASIPSEAMMHFPFVSDFSPVSEKFSDSVENFPNFPPISTKLFFPPTFKNSPLFSENLRAIYILCVFFVSPYFCHDAFMHHTMHVLDAPGGKEVQTEY